jgi:cytochrome b pre-mRNA-processing protein 3
MIWPLTRRVSRDQNTISTLYGMIVAQARLACFYRDYAVADTVNGRFDLIVLHLAIVLDRLFADPALRGLGQGLFDRFCRDMDENLREMGVGDLSVPKEMHHIGNAFYGRSRAYISALEAAKGQQSKQELADVIARNVYGDCAVKGDAPRQLAAYIRKMRGDLLAQDASALGRGELRFPVPAEFLVPAI